MRNFIKVFLLLICCSILSACSDESNSSSAEAKKDHVWKEQTDMINKAREVEGMMLDSATATRKTIEQNTE